MKFLISVLLVCSLVSCNTDKHLSDNFPPILILGTSRGFGTYTGEVLKAEGFNEFIIDSLSDAKISLSYLKNFDLVILGETKVEPTEKDILSDYVKTGGNLISFRPDIELIELFGISNVKDNISDGYIKINTFKDIGSGLTPESIQFHGTSDLYILNGAEQIASIYTKSKDSSGFPAVVVNNYGKGHTAAFAYNLPESIILTRQGNPEWAGQERDKVDGPTATDLFYPMAGETQWNDPAKIAIPQADEQMRLLSHILEKFNSYKKPLPRFWYFPDQYKCIFIFTIDGEDSKESDINNEISDVESKGGNATLYEIGTYISKETVDKWISNGNEVAIHYNDVPNYANPTFSNMSVVFDTMTSNFVNAYGLSPKTVRNHWVVWCSTDSTGKKQFAEQASIEEKFEIGFDCNYYPFGGNKVYPNWIGDVGHFNGSGIPMKFADASGKILNVYQSNTQLPDETWLKENIEIKSKILIDRSLDEENYTYINANYHTWYWGECRIPGLKVLDYCKTRGVPIWTAERAYDFLKMKDEATFTNIKWSDSRLSFNLNSSLKHSNGLTFMLPLFNEDQKIKSIIKNGENISFIIRSVKGIEYAFATVTSGEKYSIIVNYDQ